MKKLRIFVDCLILGAAYGAVFGAVYGPVFWRYYVVFGAAYGPMLWPDSDSHTGLLGLITQDAMYGVLLGAAGGGIAGLLGSPTDKPEGWTFAGFCGGLVIGTFLWVSLDVVARDADRGSLSPWADGALVGWLILVIGSSLGFALSAALRSGRSVVPGVKWLAAILNNDGPPR